MDAAAVTDTTPPELPSLAEWRTRPETEETAETPEQVATAPVAEPTDRVDEDAEEEEETHAPPEKDGHRWKDPDSGMRLDLRRRPHRRMKALLEERHRIAEENRELKARLEAPAKPEKTPQASPQPVADPNDPEPQLEAFADQPDPYGAHTRALARWEARQEFKTQQAERTRIEGATRHEAQVQALQERWDANLETVRQRHPDFDSAQAALYAALPKDGRAAPLVHHMMTTPGGEDLAHYLGTHPGEVQRLYSLPPHAHLMAVGALEARLAAQRETPVTTTASRRSPPALPMTPTGTGATTTAYDPATASLAQFRKHHKVFGGRSQS